MLAPRSNGGDAIARLSHCHAAAISAKLKAYKRNSLHDIFFKVNT
jgi:hypothetical protein